MLMIGEGDLFKVKIMLKSTWKNVTDGIGMSSGFKVLIYV
jgi:hypothetical protein